MSECYEKKATVIVVNFHTKILKAQTENIVLVFYLPVSQFRFSYFPSETEKLRNNVIFTRSEEFLTKFNITKISITIFVIMINKTPGYHRDFFPPSNCRKNVFQKIYRSKCLLSTAIFTFFSQFSKKNLHFFQKTLKFLSKKAFDGNFTISFLLKNKICQLFTILKKSSFQKVSNFFSKKTDFRTVSRKITNSIALCTKFALIQQKCSSLKLCNWQASVTKTHTLSALFSTHIEIWRKIILKILFSSFVQNPNMTEKNNVSQFLRVQ